MGTRDGGRRGGLGGAGMLRAGSGPKVAGPVSSQPAKFLKNIPDTAILIPDHNSRIPELRGSPF